MAGVAAATLAGGGVVVTADTAQAQFFYPGYYRPHYRPYGFYGPRYYGYRGYGPRYYGYRRYGYRRFY